MELNQEHIINVDYNMGMPIDLIDRDVLLPFPKALQPELSFGGVKREEDPAQKEREAKELAALREQFLDEKDRFLLSDRATFEVEERLLQQPEKKFKIPARYEIIDKVNKWGVDIRNPIAVRKNDDKMETKSVFTTEKDKGKRELAI